MTNLISKTKVNFLDFNDTKKVSKLKYILPLDKNAFSGLPKGDLRIQGITSSLVDADNKQRDYANTKKVTLEVQDVNNLGDFDEKKFLSMGMTKDQVALISASFQKSFYLIFSINDSFSKYYGYDGKQLFDWLDKYNLFDDCRNKVITGLDYAVIWQFESSFSNKLGLVVTDISKAKVIADDSSSK